MDDNDHSGCFLALIFIIIALVVIACGDSDSNELPPIPVYGETNWDR